MIKVSDIKFNDIELQELYDNHVDTVIFDLKYLDQINNDIKNLEIFLGKTLNINETGFATPDFILWWCKKEKRIFCSFPAYFENDRRLLETPKEVRNIIGEHLVSFAKHCLGVK
jgi:hypothetical protein